MQGHQQSHGFTKEPNDMCVEFSRVLPMQCVSLPAFSVSVFHLEMALHRMPTFPPASIHPFAVQMRVQQIMMAGLPSKFSNRN